MINTSAVYRIRNDFLSDKVLELDETDMRFGMFSRCRIANYRSSANQFFKFVHISGNRYRIQNYLNPQFVIGYEPTDSLWPVVGVGIKHQVHFPAYTSWRVVDAGDGRVEFVGESSNSTEPFVPGNTDLLLDYYGVDASQIFDSCVVNHRLINNDGHSPTHPSWILEVVDPNGLPPQFVHPFSKPDILYRIANMANPNTVLTIDNDAHSAHLGSGTIETQYFYEQPVGEGWYKYCCYGADNIVLTACDLTYRTPVVGAPWVDSDNQKWKTTDGTDNVNVRVQCKAANGAYYLDVNGSQPTGNGDGSRCVMWGIDNGNTQRWDLDSVSGLSQTNIVRFKNRANTSSFLQVDISGTGDGAIALVCPVDSARSQLFTVSRNSSGCAVIGANISPNHVLTSTGHGKEYMVLGQSESGNRLQEWFIEPLLGSAFAIAVDSNSQRRYFVDELGGLVGNTQYCVVRMNCFSINEQRLSAQWLFEEILPALQSGVRICHIRVAEGSFASALQVGAVDGTGSYALTFAAADEEETDQQFEMHINSDGTRTFVSCTYPGYAITLTSQALNGAVKCSYMANGTPTDAQKWRCFQSVDGTYEIRSMADANWLLARTSSAGTGCNVASFDEESLLERWSITVLGEGEGGEPAGDPVYWNEKKLVYRIRNASVPSLAVTLDAPRPASGTVATMETVTNATNQLFEIQPHDDGSCTLRVCANRSLALTAAGTIGAGSVVQGVTDSGLASQRWRLVRQHDGTFAIACRQDHYAWLLDIRDSGLQAGTSCTVQRSDGASSQKWTLEPVVVDTDGTYIQDGLSTVRIRNFSNAQTPIYAQISSAAHAELSELARPNHLGFGVFNHNAAQVFNLNPQVSGAYIESAQDPAEGQVLPLALTADSLIQRAPVHGLTEGSASNQLWNWELQGDGTYLVKLLNNNSWYLDATGFSAAASSFGMVWPTIGPDATHKWLFEPADESDTPASGDWNIPSGPTTLYYIRNVCNNLVVLQFNTTPPANGCAMSTCHPSLGLNQLFEKQENDDGNDTVTFLSYPGRDVAMTATGYVYRDAVQGTSYQDPPTTAQKWVIDELSGGTTQIVCDGTSGMRLDTNGSTTEHLAGAIVWGYNGGTTQQWTFDEVEVLAPGTQSNPVYPIVRIRSVDTSTVAAEVKIDSQTNAKPVRTVTVASSDRQKFMMRANNDGTVTFISVAAPTLALTAKNLYNRGDVTAETLDSSENAAYQKWTVQLKTDGTYHIVSAYNSAWRLDIDGPSAGNDTYCCMWQENTGTAQKWVIEYVAIVAE